MNAWPNGYGRSTPSHTRPQHHLSIRDPCRFAARSGNLSGHSAHDCRAGQGQGSRQGHSGDDASLPAGHDDRSLHAVSRRGGPFNGEFDLRGTQRYGYLWIGSSAKSSPQSDRAAASIRADECSAGNNNAANREFLCEAGSRSGFGICDQNATKLGCWTVSK
jgi:hypothetical protein